LQIAALITALLALAGMAQLILGARLTERFCARPRRPPLARPPVSVMKPLCGVEPLLEEALESFFLLDYPEYQLVFGVQNSADPVLPLLARLRERYPERDVALMVNDTPHGRNRKIANLINMRPLARHERLVIADADVHVPPYYLDSIAAALAAPGAGLATTLYTGLPAGPGLAARLGAMQINHNFLPGALLARWLGRQDCLGATMALSKTTLARIGGFAALADHLADDQVLGRRVRAAGLGVALAQVIPATTVPEADLAALFRHELRWGRTIRALVPLAFAGTILQIPLFWAVLALACSGFAWWGALLCLGALALRALCAQRVEAALRLPPTGAIWLFPLRDFLSIIIYIASFTGRRVMWRGTPLTADSGRVEPS
jgi:ceramide glucosyltransferase